MVPTAESYWDRVRDSKTPYNFRLRLVRFYLQTQNCSLTAKAFKTSRQTVMKWVNRFLKEGLEGLGGKKKGPKISPWRTSKEVEALVIEYRQTFKTIGQERLRWLLLKEHGISLSSRTINRILHAHGLIQKKRKKPHKKRDGKEYKEYPKSLEVLEFDTKDLKDIDGLRRQILDGKLPRYQFTARCPRSGLAVISFGYSNDSTNAGIFAAYVFSRLALLGILPKAKTDNGSEYLNRGTRGKKSNFTYIVEDIFKSEHILIPPSTPEYNGGVESFHGIIEREFYRIENISDEEELLSKSLTYMLYYNILRPTIGKRWKTPREVLKEELAELSPQIFLIPPIILDKNIELIENLNKLKFANVSGNQDTLALTGLVLPRCP